MCGCLSGATALMTISDEVEKLKDFAQREARINRNIAVAVTWLREYAKALEDGAIFDGEKLLEQLRTLADLLERTVEP